MLLRVAIAASLFFVSIPAWAQGIVGDLLAGKLVNPTVGQWAWYDVSATDGTRQYVIRQAIVDKEKVGTDDGYWVEFEIVPEVGYKAVYKMLLTGPASDPANIHRVIEKMGSEPAREVAVEDTANSDSGGLFSRAKRKSLGMEPIKTPQGVVRAEHYQVDDTGVPTDIWINEQILPTGVVQVKSRDGFMLLRSHGQGGEYAKSLITESPAPPVTEPTVPKFQTQTRVVPKAEENEPVEDKP